MKTAPLALAAWVALAVIGFGQQPLNAAPFTFAGYTFDPANSPDTIGLLGNGQNLGGAVFSSQLPNRITQSVGFGAQSVGGGGVFTPVAGWAAGSSLGQMANAQLGLTQSDGTGSHFSSAVNLPRGNDGGASRHGLSLSWGSGQGLVNGAGTDFVVYESGSPGSPEALMVRLGLGGGAFTDWFFQANSGFEAYLGDNEGAFAYAFDLSMFGMAAGDMIFSIEIANLRPTDRIGPGGLVNFAGVGAAPGFPSGSYDPDPLYVGIVSQLAPAPAEVPEPASLALWSLMGAAGLAYRWRKQKRASA